MRSASSRPRPQAYRPCCPSAWARRRASSPMVLALISSRTAGWPGGGSAQYSPVARPCQIRHCGYRRLSRSSSASSPSPRGPPVMARDGGLRRRGPQADEAAMTASAQRLAPARRTLRCRRASTRHAQGSGGSARPGQGRSSRSPPAAKGVEQVRCGITARSRPAAAGRAGNPAALQTAAPASCPRQGIRDPVRAVQPSRLLTSAESRRGHCAR